MSDTFTNLEAEITAAGHQLERTYERNVADNPRPGDRGWVVHVDGEVVATGGSVGRVEAWCQHPSVSSSSIPGHRPLSPASHP